MYINLLSYTCIYNTYIGIYICLCLKNILTLTIAITPLQLNQVILESITRPRNRASGTRAEKRDIQIIDEGFSLSETSM